jgi:3-phosphoshikimate 1-carboxyvinyltransferase
VARGESWLENLGDGEDVRACLALVEHAGAVLEPLPCAGVRVGGAPPGPAGGLASEWALQVGESGTLARLATALAALASRPGTRWTIGARGSLLFRRSLPLFGALRAAGVEIRNQNLPGTWPVELVSSVPPARIRLERPVSSQEVSGLLLALAAHPGRRELLVRGTIPSRPYVDLTVQVLRSFQVAPVETRAGEAETLFALAGPLVARAQPLVIEPDASSAAVALAAACLSGGELRIPGLAHHSAQGDLRIGAHLGAFGCEARREQDALSARGFPTCGAELDLTGEPDLAPVLAAVAAGAALRHGATSVLAGLATLPGKESDRLRVLEEGLSRCGLRAEAGSDRLAIAPDPSARIPETIPLDPRGDHRMAFAFALLGLLRPGVLVRDPGCVAKSWPSFWQDLEGLGARLLRD